MVDRKKVPPRVIYLQIHGVGECDSDCEYKGEIWGEHTWSEEKKEACDVKYIRWAVHKKILDKERKKAGACRECDNLKHKSDTTTGLKRKLKEEAK